MDLVRDGNRLLVVLLHALPPDNFQMKWADSLPVPADVIRAMPPKSLTPEWFQARRGRVTASKRAHIIHSGKPADWKAMAADLMVEMSDDWTHEDKDNVPMAWGRDHEREGLDAVDRALGALTEPGFCVHPDHDYAGATPDGFIGDDVTVQLKCPYQPKNHLIYFIDGKLSIDYYVQVQFESWITGRPNIIFASYDPRQGKARRLCLIDVPVNNAYHGAFEASLNLFRQRFESGNWPAEVRQQGIPEHL